MSDYIIIGGDLRFIYAAARLNARGGQCGCYGFDMLHEDVQRETGVQLLAKPRRSANVILPLPMSRGCDYITAPYHAGRISLSAVADFCDEGATLYCGKACPQMQELCDKNGYRLVDYFEREELTVANAAITAEGALEIIMRENPKAVMGMRILITGYGRIAKILSRQLHSLGADVVVAARKVGDLEWAKIAGCTAVHVSDIDDTLPTIDTIVNTVPARLFDRERLSRIRGDCLLLDLASKPGVEGMELCKSPHGSVAGVKVIWALSLPGKIAPVTAGEMIADTVLNIIREGDSAGNP
ncbi:MAG: dipicolinate synthase [Oscillospiraceae bacterium]|nr:dipicolinate synthase [Oscillospiraceae bacterium]